MLHPCTLVAGDVSIDDAIGRGEHAKGMQGKFGVILTAEVVHTRGEKAREVSMGYAGRRLGPVNQG